MKPRQTPDEYWESVLTATHPMLRFGRSLFGMIPSSPRCKLCYAPFHGFGGKVMKLLGKAPWERNPNLCRACFSSLSKVGVGGVEIEVSLMFADIRGSTALAEMMSPREYSELINRFFRTATDVIVKHDGMIDQLVGDEVVGLFLPAFTGNEHARQAIEAGRKLMGAMAQQRSEEHRLPLGIGVHTGIAYVGSVGSAESFTDFTVLGDAVNTTARLASAASSGEIILSSAAIEHAALDVRGEEQRTLTLKGKAESFEVTVLRSQALPHSS